MPRKIPENWTTLYVWDLVAGGTFPNDLSHALLGTRIDRHKKTARYEQGGFFVRSGASVSLFPLRRISTPHKINLLEAIRGFKGKQVSFSTVTCANSEDTVLKKHPIGCSFGTELCVRSCSVPRF